MNVHKLISLLIALSGLVFTNGLAIAQSSTRIVAIVNDEPISSHDINMRTKLYLANSRDVTVRLKKKLGSKRTQKLWRKMIEDYQPQSKAEAKKLQRKLVLRLRREIQGSMKGKLKKKILKELIDERIQMQQANKLGVAMTDEELDDRLLKIASRNKNKKTGKAMTLKQFLASIARMGMPVPEFRNRMKAKSSWIRVIRRKFQFQVNIGDQEVDRLIKTQKDKNAPLQTIYKVQRVRLAMKASASEASKAAQLVRAEKLRQKINSCGQLKKAVSHMDSASLKPFGSKPADRFPHTIRAFLASTKDGHLTPPTLTSSGIELYAVCGRKQRRIADQSRRKAVKEKLRQQEFEVLARRHLQDLRQDASIEYR